MWVQRVECNDQIERKLRPPFLDHAAEIANIVWLESRNGAFHSIEMATSRISDIVLIDEFERVLLP